MNRKKTIFTSVILLLVLVSVATIATLSLQAESVRSAGNIGSIGTVGRSEIQSTGWASVCCGRGCGAFGDYCIGNGEYACCK